MLQSPINAREEDQSVRASLRHEDEFEIKKYPMSQYRLDYLQQLESEAIHIMREVAGQFERPALLFSGGKDSITLVHLALKAFRPGKFPFPLVHIDTGHSFPEALDFRDELENAIVEKLMVRKVADTIKEKKLTV